jgi:hypothetical protein
MRKWLERAPVAPFREAIELAERHADAPVPRGELKRHQDALHGRLLQKNVYRQIPKDLFISVDTRGWFLLRPEALGENVQIIAESFGGVAWQANLLRDIFGNPFRPITLEPSWLTWHGGLLVSMGQRMYDSRDFSDMPVLADALEEAGCQDQDILGHCRSGGEHVRGCWVVDLLLGKE